MSTNESSFYPNSIGSISGFTEARIPTANPNLVVTGWSVDQLRAFLSNQSEMNFPSDTWLLAVEQMIRAHEADTSNPHRTTLNQIVGDFVEGVLGYITPGTPPSTPPFYSLDASVELPYGDIFPADFTTTNLYRHNTAGRFVDPVTVDGVMATDYASGVAGVPLFSEMTNTVSPTWYQSGSSGLNTALAVSTIGGSIYPFSIYDVTETPVTGLFGVDIPMTQDLATAYVTSFILLPSNTGGNVRIYQPTAPSEFMEVNLETGAYEITGETLIGLVSAYSNGGYYVSVGYVSHNPTPDNFIRVVHFDDQSDASGARDGSLGRRVFTIGKPQNTKSTLNQPLIKNTAQPASTSPLVLKFDKVSAPASFDTLLIDLSVSMYPTQAEHTVPFSTILSFGPLQITRDQTVVRVRVGGTTVFTSTILPGINTFGLSYSRTRLIFKDLSSPPQTATGAYPALPTTTVSLGPCGGYLHRAAFYTGAETSQVVEFLVDA